MLGLVEFIMHDMTYSADSTSEYIDVPIPAGDPAYDPKGYSNYSRVMMGFHYTVLCTANHLYQSTQHTHIHGLS